MVSRWQEEQMAASGCARWAPTSLSLIHISHQMAVVQHQDLIRVLQASGTLADNEHGQAAGQSRQCLAQGGVGGVV